MQIQCKGNLIDLSQPKVMGIINLTPDSFYAESRQQEIDNVLKLCDKMLSDGADFIDLGACSSKPGAEAVSEAEEMQRLLPTLEELCKRYPTALFSIDTFRATVAKESLELGAAMINDISAGNLDANMLATVGQYKAPYIAMHMQGTPENMQNNPNYENDIVETLIYFFSQKIKAAYAAGINDIILDPGFGFGKTIAHNYKMLKHFDHFQVLGQPLLAGVSRKSMIYKLLESSPEEALNGTSVAHTLALQKGANILRVHDVREAKECIKILEAVQ